MKKLEAIAAHTETLNEGYVEHSRLTERLLKFTIDENESSALRYEHMWVT